MDLSWINTTLTASLMATLSTVGIYLSLILFTRISGVQPFSKLSNFDFAITVVIGLLIASAVISKDPPLLIMVVALASLFLIQMLADNKLILLMKGDTMLFENMQIAKIVLTYWPN